MSADDFLWLVTQAVFLAVFLDVSIEAIRRPRLAHFDIALFFGAIVAIIAVSDAERLLGGTTHPVLQATSYIAVSALPYLALRIVDDFAPQSVWLMRVTTAVFALLVVAAIAVPQPYPTLFQILPVLWFILLGGHASLEFLRGAERTTGVTSRRMTAAAIGSLLVALVFALSILTLLIPSTAGPTGVLTRALALTAGIAYFLGFSPPQILRRAWQEPELRAFLGRAASLPRLPDVASIRREIERGAAASTGAPNAALGIWNPDRERLVYAGVDGQLAEFDGSDLIGGRAFREQRPIFSGNPSRDDPANAELYRSNDVGAILAAPVSAGERRLGVLSVYAPRAPIFADDDLELVRLLADQAAVVLESRGLIDEASRVQAREEAARLKDDFLSAAAHDLRSPLTTLLLHAEMMKRTAREHPEAPAEERRISTIVREGNRLKSLVSDFLDAARAERGRLLGRLDRVDLVELANEVSQRLATKRHPVRVQASAAVVGRFDADRLAQLFDNLVENAIKYSPDGGPVTIGIGSQGHQARVDVSDVGIGVPPEDLAHLFDRFHRGTNVDDRRFQGLGLGLYICRAIVEDHGGRIWAESRVGEGTTFHVELPLNAEEPEPETAAQPVETAHAPSTGPIQEPAHGAADA
ncbi:MAG TPA: ATP-binding protein [Candidatus Limnocylindria bacterium]|nr:ATP-binding protein [Candidatus Limnocylindria bacterium]